MLLPKPLNHLCYQLNLHAANSLNLLTRRRRGVVTIGVPAHNAKLAVVCAWHVGVSRKTSAAPPELYLATAMTCFRSGRLPAALDISRKPATRV